MQQLELYAQGKGSPTLTVPPAGIGWGVGGGKRGETGVHAGSPFSSNPSPARVGPQEMRRTPSLLLPGVTDGKFAPVLFRSLGLIAPLEGEEGEQGKEGGAGRFRPGRAFHQTLTLATG